MTMTMMSSGEGGAFTMALTMFWVRGTNADTARQQQSTPTQHASNTARQHCTQSRHHSNLNAWRAVIGSCAETCL